MTTKRQLTILCDLDAIVANALKKWLAGINKDYGTSYTIADVKEYDMDKLVGPEIGDKVYSYINDDDDFYSDLEPIEGAIGVLKGAAVEGHNVVFTTSPSKNPHSASWKTIWVQEHLGMPRKHMMMGAQKDLVRGDIFIDDCPAKILAYRKAWPDAHILTIAYPYNASVASSVNLRADGWNKPKDAWQEIGRYIHRVANE